MHESVSMIDALVAESVELLRAVDRSTPTPSRPEVPGRMAQLAETMADWQHTTWTGNLDSARRLGDEFEDLARGVRAAEAGYRMVDRDRGAVGWTR
ncbi:hypothetical protein [Catellatospora vulcania]|uniref:hypothetical protein n=1 Tax=Catellatospora vulcania TaxID=1460450 RepID=UPI0012D419AE|nr:hypothetical protein [Catellatospora vulcania]